MIYFLTILFPVLGAIAGTFLRLGGRATGCLFALAAVPALLLAALYPPGVSVDWLLLGTHLELDDARRILLMLTGLLWAVGGLFGGFYLAEDPRLRSFFVYFGGAMAGNFGLLIAGDVASFYTFFALMTFASYGLVVHTRTDTARRAGRIYLVMAILGELFLITALYFAVLRADSLLLRDLAPALAAAPDGWWIFLLGLIGFGVKVGAIPLYFWLPLAHPVAPTPASAVLSGAMIKAGLVGWMHLAPVGLVDWSGIALLMIVLGLTAALGAVAVGLAQVDPKTNLAYSSISQMGLMTALLGVGLYGEVPAALLLPAVALYAFNHGTAKALLFLGTALPAKVGGAWRPVMWGGLAIGALSIAGAPLTGGLWTKYFLKTFLGDSALPGTGIFLLLLTVSAFATTVLLGRFLHLLSRIEGPARSQAPSYFFPWLVLLAAGGWWTLSPVLLPLELSEHVTKGQPLAAVYLAPASLWAALWPVAAGALFFVLTLKVARLNRWPSQQPLVPPGDLLVPILAVGRFLVGRVQAGIDGIARSFSRTTSPEAVLYDVFEMPQTKRITGGAEHFLRQWEVAGLSFLLFFIGLLFLLR
ncbi:MAG: hypothetical protein JJT96_05255 [Opitutales bacterium]|nr:hypothetical protein [Opitutales bacterium]